MAKRYRSRAKSSRASAVSARNSYYQHQRRSHEKKTVFPFLGLPAELRNRIYEFVFPPGKMIMVEQKGTRPKPRSPRAITQVCKQVRKESLPIYFHNNTFVLPGGLVDPERKGDRLQHLQPWLQDRVPSYCTSALNEVVVPYSTRTFTHRGCMGTMDTQVPTVLEFIQRGLDKLLPVEALLRPIRRSARRAPSFELDEVFSRIIEFGLMFILQPNIRMTPEVAEVFDRLVEHASSSSLPFILPTPLEVGPSLPYIDFTAWYIQAPRKYEWFNDHLLLP